MKTFETSILVNNKSIKTYNHNGKNYVIAKENSEYEIDFRNNSGGRVLVVTSVDGVDILSGAAASSDSNGYIVNAYDSLRIKGFRISDTECAAFTFSKKGDSYAAECGDIKNCGIVGVRVFEESFPATTIWNNPVWTYEPWKWTTPYSQPWPSVTYSGGTYGGFIGGATFCSTNLSNQSPILRSNSFGEVGDGPFDLGTEFGRSVLSSVREESFVRGNLIFEEDVYYASRRALLDMGVKLDSVAAISSFPQSFPDKYCKPPKNWKK